MDVAGRTGRQAGNIGQQAGMQAGRMEGGRKDRPAGRYAGR